MESSLLEGSIFGLQFPETTYDTTNTLEKNPFTSITELPDRLPFVYENTEWTEESRLAEAMTICS